jgi:hypothetical protein
MPKSKPTSGDTARILTAVANESRPYTDPKATYQLAQTARTAQAEGVARRAA